MKNLLIKLKFIYKVIVTNKVEKQISELKKQNQILINETEVLKEENQELKEKENKLNNRDQQVYDTLDEMDIPENLKSSLFKASKIVNVQVEEEQEKIDLYDKTQLANDILKLLDNHIETRIDLAEKINKREIENLKLKEKIKQDVKQAIKVNHIKKENVDNDLNLLKNAIKISKLCQCGKT